MHGVQRGPIAAFCGAAFFAAACTATGAAPTATMGAAVTPSPPVLELDESADGRKFSVAPAQIIELSLRENPTTGFRWELSAEDPAGGGQPACTVKEEGLTESAGGGVGRGGTRRWLLTAARAGGCGIVATYRRAWEKREPERTIRFSVLVSP